MGIFHKFNAYRVLIIINNKTKDKSSIQFNVDNGIKFQNTKFYWKKVYTHITRDILECNNNYKDATYFIA